MIHHESYPLAVRRGLGLFDQSDVPSGVVTDTPAVLVRAGMAAVLGELHQGKINGRRPLARHAKQFAHGRDYAVSASVSRMGSGSRPSIRVPENRLRAGNNVK